MSSLLSKLPFLSGFEGFNRTARGGPSRILVIAGVGASMAALAIGVSSFSRPVSPEAQIAKMPETDPLPGGPLRNPAQEALLVRHARDQAEKALAGGESYTPPLPASRPLEVVEKLPPAAPAKVEEPIEPPIITVPEPAPRYVPPEESHDPPARLQLIASNGEQAGNGEDPYRTAVADLLRQWDARSPRTDVVLTQAADVTVDAAAPRTQHEGTAERRLAERRTSESGRPASAVVIPERILVPAGRGVFAHTVVAVSSDSGGPLVLEADSGPLAGDRMIAAFSKNTGGGSLTGDTERLVVQVHTIEHHGQTLHVRGLVIAPDTMETAVATSVDEHYLERFALPTAAAFVAGLGQAIALSGATTQVLPYGGVATSYNKLNFQQELGVGAGAAATQFGQIVQQAVPKGPTVRLAANAGVGVLFLEDVTSPVLSATVNPASLNTR